VQAQEGIGMTAHVRLLLESEVRYDDASLLRIAGLPPQAQATLEVEATDDSGVPRFSRTTLSSQTPRDADGQITLPLAPALHRLLPADVPGFLTSLTRTPGRAAKFVHASLAPMRVRLRLWTARQLLAETSQRRHLLASGVQRETVQAGEDVRGEFFLPAQSGVAPGVLLLQGSGGGLDLHAAALLASCGHAVFAQALFAYADLPTHMVDLPVERVARGLQWLARRIGHRRIVMRGISKGSELAFRAALAAPEHVAGLVLWVPSPMPTTGRGAQPGPRALMTEQGAPVPHAVPLADEPVVDPAAHGPERPLALTPSFERQWRHADHARLIHPVERLRSPTLLVSADDDRIWPSTLACEMLLERHRRHGGAQPLVHESQPGAGHGINLPMTAEGLAHLTWHPRQRLWLAVGGTPEANGRAAGRAWQDLLAFINRCTG
jgi:dienelactone hydrolase